MGTNIRLLIINPNSDEETTAKIRTKVERLSLPGVETTVETLSYMPKLITSLEDVQKAAGGMLELVKNDARYDAYLIGCHLDPNLMLLKEITEKPVVGIGEASIRIASMQCSSFAVLSPSVRSGQRKRRMIRDNYCTEQYCGAVAVKGESREAVLEAAGEAVECFHPEGIVLGCANYALWDRDIEQCYPVKCYDGVACGMFLATGLFCYEQIKK